MSDPTTPILSHASYGWCQRCNTEHRLEQGNALGHALELQRELQELERVDYRSAPADADPGLATAYLFGEARGQMFGVLECEDSQGRTVVLRAFSCQYNSAWNIAGWVPPLFASEAYDGIMIPADREIKALGRQIAAAASDSEKLRCLRRERKHISQSIMKDLHGLYELRNFHGETRSLTEFFTETKGVPTGAGDCCAPKLLNHAARNNLRPLGIAEFYWGKTNRSRTREHGRFYGSCADRCQPILGFMLCGATP